MQALFNFYQLWEYPKAGALDLMNPSRSFRASGKAQAKRLRLSPRFSSGRTRDRHTFGAQPGRINLRLPAKRAAQVREHWRGIATRGSLWRPPNTLGRPRRRRWMEGAEMPAWAMLIPRGTGLGRLLQLVRGGLVAVGGRGCGGGWSNFSAMVSGWAAKEKNRPLNDLTDGGGRREGGGSGSSA